MPSTVLCSPYTDPYRPCDREGRRLYGEPQPSRSTPCFTPGQMLDVMMTANTKPAYHGGRTASCECHGGSLGGSRIISRELRPRTAHNDVVYETVTSMPERHRPLSSTRFLSSDGTTRLMSSTAPAVERVRTISDGRVIDERICVPTTTTLHQAPPPMLPACYPAPPMVVPTQMPPVLVPAPQPLPAGYVPVLRDPVPTVIPLQPPPQRERVIVLPPPPAPPANPYAGYWCGYWNGWNCGQQWYGQGAGGWNGRGAGFGSNAQGWSGPPTDHGQGGEGGRSHHHHHHQPQARSHQQAQAHAHSHARSHAHSRESCDEHNVNRQPLVVAKDGKVFEYVHNPKAGGTRLVEHGVLPIYGRSLTTSGATRAEIYVQMPREAP